MHLIVVKVGPGNELSVHDVYEHKRHMFSKSLGLVHDVHAIIAAFEPQEGIRVSVMYMSDCRQTWTSAMQTCSSKLAGLSRRAMHHRNIGLTLLQAPLGAKQAVLAALLSYVFTKQTGASHSDDSPAHHDMVAPDSVGPCQA